MENTKQRFSADKYQVITPNQVHIFTHISTYDKMQKAANLSKAVSKHESE